MRTLFLSMVATMTMLIVSLGSSALASPIIWNVTDGGNGHAYEVVSDSTVNWNTAMMAVESKTYLGSAGYLATVTSAAENNFILDFMISTQVLGGRYAIGGYRNGDSFAWVTGEPWIYTNWAPGEPNSGQEDSVMMYGPLSTGSDIPGTWNDLSKTEQLGSGYVVEYPGPFVSEPSTLLLLGIGAFGLSGYAWRRRKQTM